MTWMRPRMAVRLGVAVLALALAPPAVAETATFSTGQSVALFTMGPASPYPSAVEVAGMQGPLTNASVTLKMVDHSSPIMDVLLVSPAGRTAMLLSDVEGGSAQADMTFSDTAAGPHPGGPVGTAGTYRPTDNDGDPFNSDHFETPAPPPPYGADLAALNGDSPNGTWTLFVLMNGETTQNPDGQIQGWSLTLTTQPQQQPPAQDPPVQQQPPPEPTTPQVLSAGFATPPVAGQATALRVVAKDTTHEVTGLIVDFGERLGLWAESACVPGQGTAGTVTFDVPYTFGTAGAHTVTVTVISGGCGKAEVTLHTTTVEVGGARTARIATAAPRPPARAAAGCTGANALPTAANAKVIEQALLCLMNLHRARKKLRTLKLNARLKRAATLHSKAMVAGRFFAHQGPREPQLALRLRRAKYRGQAGENIGAGAGPLGSPAAMIRGWLKSPMHRRNLFDPRWRSVGIAFLPQFPLRTRDRPVATYTTNFGNRP